VHHGNQEGPNPVEYESLMVKTFFVAAGKIALAMFLAGAGLLLAALLYGWATAKMEEREARPYEEPKTWHEDLSGPIGMNVETNTKLIEGKMLVNVIMRGAPAFINEPPLMRSNEDQKFMIHFLDKHGFKLLSQEVPYRSMTRTLNPDGLAGGLAFQGDLGYVGIKQYARIEKVEVEWTIRTTLPETPPKAVPTSKTPGEDHCAPGISRQERLKRLAMKGQLRETGQNNYSAGLSSIHFWTDGSVLYCQ